MKALVMAALTAGALTIGFLPAQSFADSVHIGIGMGGGHHWHHKHCKWVHHHKKCW